MTHTYYEVIDTPISIEEVTNKVIRRECGAVTTFIGTVREFTKGRRTLCLEYVAYKTMAEKQLERIGTEVGRMAGDICRYYIALVHYKFLILLLSLLFLHHRKAAYEANKYIMERIKQIVPIWKKEFWEDGESWIGDQLERVTYANGEPRKE